jgi:hypothetical protein
VAGVRVVARKFAATGALNALGRSAVTLHLGHIFVLKIIELDY